MSANQQVTPGTPSTSGAVLWSVAAVVVLAAVIAVVTLAGPVSEIVSWILSARG